MGKEWDKVLERYKVEADDNSQIESKDKKTVTKDGIIKWCKDNLDSKIENTLYSKASKWCVTFTSMEEKLKQNNKTLQSNVQTLKSKYDTMSETLKQRINTISVTGGPPQEGEKTKQWCSDLSKRAFVSEQDDHYQNLTNYCI